MKGFSIFGAVCASLLVTATAQVVSDLCDGLDSVDFVTGVGDFDANGADSCWKKVGDNYEIRMQINNGKWLGFGLSDGQTMGSNIDIYWISYDGSTVTNQIRYATTQSTPVVESDATYMQVVSTESDGTKAQLVFTRPAAALGNRLSMETAAFVLTATGVGPSDYHGGGNRKASPNKIDFAGTGTPSPTPSPTTGSPTTAGSNTLLTDLCAGMGTLDTAAVPDIAGNGVLACWKPTTSAATTYEIRLQVNKGFWGALGLSDDNKMPGTDVYWISYDGTSAPTIENRYASSKSMPVVETDASYLVIKEARQDGTSAQVVFERPAAASGNRKSMATTGFILMATGAAPSSYHGQNKLASPAAVTFADASTTVAVASVFGNSKKMAHGAMMVFAWVFLGPTAMFDARFMKKVLDPLWFKIHMYSMITVVALTFVSIIIIVTDETVVYADLLDDSKVHAQAGIAIMVLAGFQMTIGLLRKKISNHQDGEKGHGSRRWLFNYMHWAIGLALLCLTLWNVFTGLGLGGGWVKSPVQDFYYVAVGLGVGCFVVIELLKMPGYIARKKDGDYGDTVKVISRHAFAIVTASTLASAITITTIIADSGE